MDAYRDASINIINEVIKTHVGTTRELSELGVYCVDVYRDASINIINEVIRSTRRDNSRVVPTPGLSEKYLKR